MWRRSGEDARHRGMGRRGAVVSEFITAGEAIKRTWDRIAAYRELRAEVLRQADISIVLLHLRTELSEVRAELAETREDLGVLRSRVNELERVVRRAR